MKAVVEMAKRVGPTDIPVLLAGETGSGKEIIAELIHTFSERRGKEMLCINCSGLPHDLIESELYGSAKGSFTGAGTDRDGLVRHAKHSTLFLDELSEMPLTQQSKLLRFMQDRRVRCVGGVQSETIDVRIIASVNKDPLECVAEHRLREDLYYRMSTIVISVPPLRQRREDIIPLATAYLNYFSIKLKRPVPVMGDDVKQMMLSYDWPGNVRQLTNEMNRCALLCNGVVNVSDLNIRVVKDNGVQDWMNVDLNSLTRIVQSEAKTIVATLMDSGFNRDVAAINLGMSRGTLYKKIKQFGIKTPAKSGRSGALTLHRNGHAAPSNGHLPSPTLAHPSPRSVSPPVG